MFSAAILRGFKISYMVMARVQINIKSVVVFVVFVVFVVVVLDTL